MFYVFPLFSLCASLYFLSCFSTSPVALTNACPATKGIRTTQLLPPWLLLYLLRSSAACNPYVIRSPYAWTTTAWTYFGGPPCLYVTGGPPCPYVTLWPLDESARGCFFILWSELCVFWCLNGSSTTSTSTPKSCCYITRFRQD